MTIFVWFKERLLWRSDKPQPQGRQRVKFHDVGAPREESRPQSLQGWRTHDVRPTWKALEPVVAVNDRYSQLYHLYLRGKLQAPVKQEFEEFVPDLLEFVERLERLTGRNGRLPMLLEQCRSKIIRYRRLGQWPGSLTEQQWADKLQAELRTYQRAKAVVLKGSDGV
jgi:hypothetical protein